MQDVMIIELGQSTSKNVNCSVYFHYVFPIHLIELHFKQGKTNVILNQKSLRTGFYLIT